MFDYIYPSLYSNQSIPLNWQEFFKGNIIPKYTKNQLVTFKSFIPIPLFAAIPISTKISPADAVSKAAQPIEDMVISIAKPVTIISSSWGCIECATGHPAQGIQRIKFALLGYASIRWLRLLVDAIGPY